MRNKAPSQKSYPTSDDYADPEGFGPDPALDESQAMRPLIHQSQVLPYRGQEYHGVNPNIAGEPPDINANVFDQSAVVGEPQEKNVDEPRAVPVRIVKQDDEWEQTYFRTFQNVVGPVPVRVAGHNNARTNLIVKNDDAAGVILVSSDINPNVVNSFKLGPGGQLTIAGVNGLWAVSADANSYPLSTYIEYTLSASKQAQA